MIAKRAERLSPQLDRALGVFLDARDGHLRPCFCPTCGTHFTDIVFPSERVCGVVMRACAGCHQQHR